MNQHFVANVVFAELPSLVNACTYVRPVVHAGVMSAVPFRYPLTLQPLLSCSTTTTAAPLHAA
jgi:hypothetical protein